MKATSTTSKSTTEINSAAICRCTDKQTKEVFYLVKSDSSDEWYQVRFDHSCLAWTCRCPATKPCKHERAVQEVLKIRRERIATSMGPEALAAVKHMQAEDDRCRAERQPAAVEEDFSDLIEQRPSVEIAAAMAKLRSQAQVPVKSAVAPRQCEDWSTPDGPLYCDVKSLPPVERETARCYREMAFSKF